MRRPDLPGLEQRPCDTIGRIDIVVRDLEGWCFRNRELGGTPGWAFTPSLQNMPRIETLDSVARYLHYREDGEETHVPARYQGQETRFAIPLGESWTRHQIWGRRGIGELAAAPSQGHTASVNHKPTEGTNG